MPEMNGLDAIVAIRGEFPEARIIVLTTYTGDVQILRALKSGAQGYLLKNTFHKELVDTIHAVHAGKKTLSPEASYQIAEHTMDEALTPAEVIVLSLIAAGNANKQIADRLSITEETVKVPGQEHSLQVGCSRPHPSRHDRTEARHHQTLGITSTSTYPHLNKRRCHPCSSESAKLVLNR